MRLLNVHTMKLHTFYNEKIPPYAILSHTWLADDEEVSFSQIQTPEACRHMLGFRKIEFLCGQAKEDGYEWAWMDTCGIDKTSSAELSEAINSMFAWYREAQVCYVYLADVDYEEKDDRSECDADAAGWMASRWWSRAWTLQEFLAPKIVTFYDARWKRIGDKTDKAYGIELRTGIDEETLRDPQLMFNRSVAQRMSWAAKRQATRTEDIAYSLLGIFEINMPLLYGEGARAFLRLQQQILRTVNDQSLFAWGFIPMTTEEMAKEFLFPSLPASQYGLFADMPSRFANCGKIVSYHRHGYSSDISVFNGALHLEMPLARAPGYPRRLSDHHDPQAADFGYSIGLLPCGFSGNPEYLIGIILARISGNHQFARERLGSDIFTFLVPSKIALESQTKSIWVGDGRFAHPANFDLRSELRCSIVLKLTPLPCTYTFVGALPGQVKWDDDATLHLPQDRNRWPERVAIGLFNPKTCHFICIVLRLNLVSGEPAIQLTRSKVPEGKVHGELEIRYRSQYDQQWSSKANVDECHVETEVLKRFNHLIYKLEVHIGKAMYRGNW